MGVSGGADSVCLLSVLSELQESMDLKLICAHVNHMLRETALRDERYVQRLCEQLGVPCHVLHCDVQKLAKQEKLTLEEAGRKVRYEFFHRLKEEYGATKIAIAHNKGDCAETLLFHLFRGSHLKGLGGIRPVSGDTIRPLLAIERKEIENYLRLHALEWQEDETNASTEYARNRIRHELLPTADNMYPGVVNRIADTAFALQEAQDYLEKECASAMKRCSMQKDGGIHLSAACLQKEHPFMISEIIYHALVAEKGSAKDFTQTHVNEVIKLLQLQAGRKITLPGELVVYKTSDGILVRKEEDDRKECTKEVSLFRDEPEKEQELSFFLEGLGTVKARVLSNFDFKNIPQKTYTKWLDYDKITRYAVFRKRSVGDYLQVDESGSHQTLKKYFIQEKIPSYKRDELWILADGSHVIWVPGYRISHFYKVSDETKFVLELTIMGGSRNE